MRYLIVSDIFGRTKALEDFAYELADCVDIFDPYDAKEMGFQNEAEAYNFFITNIGLNKYTSNLIHQLQSFSEPLCLIGFSVGASAIWNISSEKKLKHISNATCFYGSQVRNNKNIRPLFLVKLIFPVSEKHFSVADLIHQLSTRENVEIVETPYLHGFMNRDSENYDQTGYGQFLQSLNLQAKTD